MPSEDPAATAVHALALALRIATHAASLSSYTVLFAGGSPYRREDLEALLPAGAHAIGQDEYQSERVDLVVVGTGCDLEVVERVVDNTNCPIFLPQEGFLDRVLFGFDWWQTELAPLLNSYLNRYPGLARAKELADEQGFEWPSQEAPESLTDSVTDDSGFALETPLRRECKYQITGLTRVARWNILTTCAVPRLGLQEVAETIANHIRLRKARKGGREMFANAIGEWEWDLTRLKREFYDGHNHRFRWPGTEP